MKKITLLLLFFGFYVNAQFQQHIVTQNPADAALNPVTSAIGDIDGDGDQDIVAGTFNDNKLFWYTNNGTGQYGSQILIDTSASIITVELGDINGDGSLDIVASFWQSNKLVYYLNDGSGNFSNYTEIDVNGMDYIRDIELSDLDNDGDLDVAVASLNDDKLAWYENTDGLASFGTIQLLANDIDFAYHVDAGDVDGDGDIDLLTIAGGSNGEIIWFENTDGQGAFTNRHTVINDFRYSRSAELGDIDGDGDLDIVFAVRSGTIPHGLYWLENDGTGSYTNQHTIELDYKGYVVNLKDVDNDGDLDIVSHDFENINYFENQSSGSAFINHLVITTTGSFWFFTVGDLNNDNHQDIVSNDTAENAINVHLFDANQSYLPPVRLTPMAYHAKAVIAVDFAGAGQSDVIAGFSTSKKLSKFDAGSFQETLLSDEYDIEFIKLADIDGDGNNDLLFFTDGGFGWYKNENGNLIQQTYNSGYDWNGYYYSSVQVSDVDDDNDLDIVMTGYFAVQLFKNDGQGNFSLVQFYPTNWSYNSFLASALIDMDNDGHLDLLVSKKSGQQLIWFAFDPSTGLFNETEQVLENNVSYNHIESLDIDNDGNIDFIATQPGETYLYIKGYGTANFNRHLIDTKGYLKLVMADIDQDNKLDIVAIASSNTAPSLCWYKNLGNGTFGSQQVLESAPMYANDVFVTDYDEDGDMDIFMTESNGKVFYYENMSTSIITVNTNNSFSIYPNPTNHYLQIYTNDTIKSFKIFDMLGHVYNTYTIKNNIIDVSGLSLGTYIISIKDTNEHVEVLKFVKK